MKRTIILTAFIVLVLPLLFTPKKAVAKFDGVGYLKVLSTTDLHGQSIRYSYDSASDHVGSLAQISTVVKQEKKKNKKHGTTLLVDSGDVLFGRAAEGIRNGEFSGTQYMYKIMKNMGYDAMTLGNHDFDYGFSHTKEALLQAGLSDKVVLSNVVNAKTKKKIYATSRIIKRKVKTTKGKKRIVRIGITGCVTPNLGTFSDLTGEVQTQDIISCVKAEVRKLKKKKADVVIVLSHSGMGPQRKQKKMQTNVSYRIALLDDVDLVCAGHSHFDYPSTTSGNAKVLDYDMVDPDTGMVDETLLVEEADHGVSLGISSIALKFYGKEVEVVTKSSKIRKIKDTDKEDPNVIKWNSAYDKTYRKMYDAPLATMGGITNNYFGMLEDNSLIQLANEAKISYGIKLKQELPEEFSNCPVIAATVYKNAGGISGSDYIASEGSISYGTLLKLQTYGQKLARAHYLTGAQLRECLEWCAASVYNDPNSELPYSGSDFNMKTLAEIGKITPLVSPEWENWKGMLVFDGIEYSIDATKPPRYNKAGTQMINDSHRIKSITINNVPLKDTDRVILISNTVQPEDGILPALKNQIADQLVMNTSGEHLTEILENYLAEQSMGGDVSVEEDSNWSVEFDPERNYLLRSSESSQQHGMGKRWYQNIMLNSGGYTYYISRFDNLYEDTSGPMLAVSKLTDDIQGEPIGIGVQASDASGISSLEYRLGTYSYTDEWTGGIRIINNYFRVGENGIYTVRAVDGKGNISIRYVAVTNLDTDVANTPKVNSITNRGRLISGIVSPNATAYIKTENDTLETVADEEGYFECATDYLPAESVIKVWQVDEIGRTSVTVDVVVERECANFPTVSDVTNKNTVITGKLDDSKYCKIAVVRGNTVYVPEGQEKIVKAAYFYKKTMDVEEVKYKFNEKKKKFAIRIPKLYADQKVDVYSFDWLGRSSDVTERSVADVAPNAPVVDRVISEEGFVYGRIPGFKPETAYTVNVIVKDDIYSGKVDENGYFTVRTSGINSGDTVKVSASDSLDGEIRNSISTAKKAGSFTKISDEEFVNARIERTTNKDTIILGKIGKNYGTKVQILYGNHHKVLEIDDDGEFAFKPEKELKVGTKIGVISRSVNGDINTFRYTTVKLAKPDAPEFVTKDITEDTTKVVLKAVDRADAYLRIGKKKYKPVKIKKRKTYYVYKFEVKDVKEGNLVTAYLRNKAGASEKSRFGRV